MSAIDSLLGCLLVATWLNSMLFGIQLLQGYTYFTTYRDEVYLKAVVLLLYSVDIVGMMGQYTTVYLDAVTHYGDRNYLNAPEAAPRGMYLAAIQLGGAIVQCYLVSRIYRLSKNLYISILLWAGSLMALAGGLTLTVINVTFKSLADRSRQGVPTSIWLVGAAVVDVLIAVILAFFLWQAKRKSTFAHTHHVLKRLMASSLEIGAITAILAIVVEVLFNKLKKTNLQVAFVFLLGRAYSITMMYNLNSRAELRTAHRSHPTTDSAVMSLSQRAGVARTPMARTFAESGNYPIEIQVAQTAVSKSDDPLKHEQLGPISPYERSPYRESTKSGFAM